MASLRDERRPVAGKAMPMVAAMMLLAGWSAAQTPSHGAAPTNPIQASVQLDKKSYSPGQPVVITFVVKNASKAPITLSFSSAQRYDLEIRSKDRKGPLLWQWSRGMVFAQSLGHEDVAAGKSLIYHVTLRPGDHGTPKLAPGNYSVVATLTSMPRTARPHASVEFAVK